MATVNLSPIGNSTQFLLSTGAVNANGYLSTYQAGTSTPVATYNSSAGSVQNPTSIPLGTDGSCPSEVWIVSGTAVKFVLEDSSGVPISGKTWDNIKGINDDTGLGVYWCGTATGTANALVLTPATPSTAYTAGAVYYFKSGAAANTGATTVNISTLGNITIQLNGSALSGGEIQANQWYTLLIDASTTSAQISQIGLYAPVPIAMGGTGAVTAGAARTNLAVNRYTGSFTTAALATNATETHTITHSLGTDSVLVDVRAQKNDSGGGQGGTWVISIIWPDGSNKIVQGPSSLDTTGLLTAPSTGKINLIVRNNGGSTNTITVNYVISVAT